MAVDILQREDEVFGMVGIRRSTGLRVGDGRGIDARHEVRVLLPTAISLRIELYRRCRWQNQIGVVYQRLQVFSEYRTIIGGSIADVRQRDKANQNIENSQEAESTQDNAVQDSPESENYSEKHKVISLKLGNEIDREAIMKLRIEKRADDDCALFIWCQYHILSEIFKSNLIEDCGFKYQTIAFVLTESDKTSELCVLAARGNPILADTPLPKITNVSGKEFGELIKEVVGDIPVCELS